MLKFEILKHIATTSGIVQFAIYGSGRLRKSARQTDTIPPAVVRNAKTTAVVQVSAYFQCRLILFLHRSKNMNDFFR